MTVWSSFVIFSSFLLYFVMMLGVDSILSKKKKQKKINLNCVVQSIDKSSFVFVVNSQCFQDGSFIGKN